MNRNELPKQADIKLTNSLEHAVTLHLEPWGEQHQLLANETIEIEAFSEYRTDLEIEIRDNDIYLWGWAGSSCNVNLGEKDTLNPMAPIWSDDD